MKQLLIVVVTLILTGSSLSFAETHQSGNTGSTRTDAVAKPQSRIFEYISACLAGRPSSGSASAGIVGSSSSPNTGIGNGSGVGGSGEAIFRSKCLTCHGGTSGPPNLTLLDSSAAEKALTQVSAGNMPPPTNGSLSSDEKAALIQFLQTKR